MLTFKPVLYSLQFTRQYLIEKSIHLLSPSQLKHSQCHTICVRLLLVEMLFIFFFFFLLMWVCLLSIYLIFIFCIWPRNEAVNSYIEIRIHFCSTIWNLWEKKYLSVTSRSCAGIIHYTASILLFIHFRFTTFLVPINLLFSCLIR